jgi:carboxypeptidase family protein
MMTSVKLLMRGLRLFPVLVVAACVDGVPTDLSDMAGPDIPLQFALVTQSSLSTDETEAINNAFDAIDQIRIRLFREGESEPFVDTLVTVVPGQDAYSIEIPVPAEDIGQEVAVEMAGSAGGVELFASTAEVTVTDAAATAGGAGEQPVVTLPIRYTGPGLAGTVIDPDGRPGVGMEVDLIQDGNVVQTTATSIEGDFLFTDLAGATYTVQVRVGEGLVSCPASRVVGPLTESTRVDGGFKLSRTNCTLKILVLSGGDLDDTGGVSGSLGAQIAEGQFSRDFVVVNPPSLGSLRSFDAIVLYENGSYDHATAVGDRIAQYVNAGGNLIIGSFYWQNRSDGGYGHPGWGALEGMDVLGSSGGTRYAQGSVGSLSEHPITDGVAPFSVPRWWGGVSGGGNVVATWSDGTPLAAYSIHAGGQRVVAISAFPGLMGSADGELAKLWGNAVRWAASAGGPNQNGVNSQLGR